MRYCTVSHNAFTIFFFFFPMSSSLLLLLQVRTQDMGGYSGTSDFIQAVIHNLDWWGSLLCEHGIVCRMRCDWKNGQYDLMEVWTVENLPWLICLPFVYFYIYYLTFFLSVLEIKECFAKSISQPITALSFNLVN